MVLFQLLWTILLLSVATSTNYYVSSTSGSDSNSGTSSNSPWKTFINIKTLKLSDGDQLLLKCNDDWYEQLYIKNARGSKSNPVTISSYGNGYRPWINAMRLNITKVIICVDCENIIFSYLEIFGSQIGISLEFTLTNTTLYNYNITNNFFHRIRGTQYNATTGNWWGKCVITSSTNPLQIDNLIFERNLVNFSDTFYHNEAGVTILSGHMFGNTLTHNSYNVMNIDDLMYNFTIESNVFLHDTPIQKFVHGTTDVIIGECDENCKIINNEFGYRGEWPGAPDGCSIDFELAAIGSSVIGNYIHHSYAAAIMVFGHRQTNTFNYNLTIDHNIFIQDGCLQTAGDHGTIAIMNPSSGNITNNVFVKCINQSIPIYWYNNNDTFIKDWTFRNNTIYNYTNGHIVNDPIFTITRDKVNNVAIVNASCKDPNCVLRYTVDGSKPNSSSMQWINNQTLKVYNATSVLFKGFVVGLIESATVGGIIDTR